MRVKKGTPMGEVFKQYAEKKGLQEKSLSFVAGGKTIPTDAKPMDLKKTVSEPVSTPTPAEDPPPVVDKGDDPCACMSCMG